MKRITPIIGSFCTTGIAVLLLITGLLTACRSTAQADSPTASPQTLSVTETTLAGHKLNISLARTYEEKAKGLMYVENMPDNSGMLFVYETPQIMSFWMKNTKIPLDLVFFTENLEINGWIKDMQPGFGLPENNLPRYVSEQPAQYALELNAGSIERLKLKFGDRLEIPLMLLYSD